jgi:tRNA1Val (adenine37-N6)-methyltransferase
MLLEGEHLEPLSRDISVIVSGRHRFNTDTILLAAFSAPRTGEVCADLGTGCGTIPLIWCGKGKPKAVYAVEIQEDACELARRSAALNGLSDVIHIVNCDIKSLRAAGAEIPQPLDLIACNPPYKTDGAGMQNPSEGLRIARHEVACSFADIAAAAASLLRWGGRFCCCLRPERLCDALFTLRAAGIEPKRLRFVQQRQGKAPSLFLLQANRGGKPGMAVDPVLLIEDASGGFSEEMKKIYGDYWEEHK